MLAENLQPKLVNKEEMSVADSKAKEQYKHHYDKRHGVRSLPTLRPGEQVMVKLPQNKRWESKGIVTLADPHRRKYQVETPSGTVTRNRMHLQSAPRVQDRPRVKGLTKEE